LTSAVLLSQNPYCFSFSSVGGSEPSKLLDLG
jgi:hypothetical protein